MRQIVKPVPPIIAPKRILLSVTLLLVLAVAALPMMEVEGADVKNIIPGLCVAVIGIATGRFVGNIFDKRVGTVDESDTGDIFIVIEGTAEGSKDDFESGKSLGTVDGKYEDFEVGSSEGAGVGGKDGLEYGSEDDSDDVCDDGSNEGNLVMATELPTEEA